MNNFRIKGFRGAAVAAGIKYEGRLDLGLIASDRPAVTAAVFTRNVVKAAPVLAGMKRMSRSDCTTSAIVANSGNANACTGNAGMEDYYSVCSEAARLLKVDAAQVAFSSTGVIGEPLPVDRFFSALPDAVANLSEDGLVDVADAILTTDTVRKVAVRQVEIDGCEVTLAGMAKGAGMIGPHMGPPQATMLCFIMTDAAVQGRWWQDSLTAATEMSFNRILVDGDTSTNDTVYALANGMAGNVPISDETPGADMLSQSLADIMKDLALQIVRDGEGATKCVGITVKGGPDDYAAEKVARTVAESPLVKTAFFGQDPNWGRVFAAAGRAGVDFDPDCVSLWIGDVQIAAKGRGLGPDSEGQAAKIMTGREFSLTLDIGMGKGSATVYTCDFSDEYVHINADYRT